MAFPTSAARLSPTEESGMLRHCARWYPALLLAALLAGCQEKTAGTNGNAAGPPPDPEAEIRASLANLGR